MVKRVSLTLFFILLIVVVLINNHADGDSYREIVIGSPPKDAGEWIAKGGGYKLIEFWHSSSGYWKATMNTESGKKVLVINDDETDKDAWTKPEFMKNRIYASKFILEYKINHPKEVTDALKNGATITPILNICKETIYCSDNKELTIDKFFNFEPLPDGNKAGLPEKPELIVGEECILIRALPQLSCQIETFNEKVTFYPHKIPIVDTSCGSLSYAMYHHEGGAYGHWLFT